MSTWHCSFFAFLKAAPAGYVPGSAIVKALGSRSPLENCRADDVAPAVIFDQLDIYALAEPETMQRIHSAKLS